MRQQQLDAAGPMAEDCFDMIAQFAKGAMVLHDLEEWIVAEAGGTGWPEADSPMAVSFAFGSHEATRISQGQVANIVRRALFQWRRRQLFEQPSVVVGVGCLGAGITGRKHARATVQGIDGDSAVLAQDPLAQMPRLLRGFQPGILREAFAGFFDAQGLGKVSQRAQVEPQAREQRQQFAAFLAISRA